MTTKNKSDTTKYVGRVFFRMLSPNQSGNLNNSTIFTFLTQTRCEKMGVEAATKITGVHSKPAVCQTCSVKHKYTVLSQNMDANILYFIIIWSDMTILGILRQTQKSNQIAYTPGLSGNHVFFYFRIAQFKGLFCFDRAWNNILNISKIPRICGSSMVHKPFAQPAAIPIDLFCASCTWVYVARNRLALYLFHVNA